MGQFWLALGRGSGDNRIHDSAFVDSLPRQASGLYGITQQNITEKFRQYLVRLADPVPIHFRSFVPRTRSKALFVFAMSCYCWTLTSFVSTSRYAIHVKSPPPAFYLRGDASDVIALLLFAPVVESLILIGVFELVRRAHAPVAIQILAAASFISVTHVWPWWPHAVIVLPSFCIQAAAYFYWRRVSWKQAFWILVSIHALNNVIPTLSVIGRAMRHA